MTVSDSRQVEIAMNAVFGTPEQSQLREVDATNSPAPVEWLIDNVVARGAVTMLAGEAKTGKSLLALQWAATAQVGMVTDPTKPNPKPQRVVIIDAENGASVIQQRLAKYPSKPTVFEARGFNLDDGFDQVENVIAGGCDLLILDSWVSLWTGNENSISDVKRILEGLRTLAHRYNVGVLILHHTTKGSDTYRGSGSIAGVVEGIFTLTRGDRPGERLLSCKGLRLGPEPADVVYTLDANADFCRALVRPSEARATAQSRATRALTPRELIRLQELKTLSKRDVRRYLGEPVRWWRLGK